MTNCLNKTGSASLSEADLRSFGRSTGLRLKGKDPEKYGSIVRALEAGCSLRELARIFKISKNTAGAICLRELGQEGLKKATIRNLQRLVHEFLRGILRPKYPHESKLLLVQGHSNHLQEARQAFRE